MGNKRWGRGGYRPGYSEKHSPFYTAGLADGQADAARERAEDRQGMDADRSWSAMYRRGYADGLGSGSDEAAS
jgi:hypothetical protein